MRLVNEQYQSTILQAAPQTQKIAFVGRNIFTFMNKRRLIVDLKGSSKKIVGPPPFNKGIENPLLCHQRSPLTWEA